ncbi:NepR family anti-sigma factor [Pseudaestuariivita rosea]|uniref:NepR family anti-sigma factor n=1 Tax=Pseudaestuariivita rosea TaxID=2763263 RepID=UPI001ABB5549|nr:NepR family anti-sigma factor [Pseudaestuariivita rosea]
MANDMPPSKPKSVAEDQVDQNLKRFFDDMLSEEVPDKLTDLLQQLKQEEQSKDGND